MFVRTEEMARRIDEAFEGRPFCPLWGPVDPRNQRRVHAYLRAQKQVLKLFGYVLELWMITFGLKPEDDWVPIVVEDMRRKYAAQALKSSDRKN